MAKRYETMPDGTVVAVPSDISPEALNRVRAKYKPTRKQAEQKERKKTGVNVEPNSRRKAVDARKEEINKGGFLRNAATTALSYLPDEVRNATVDTLRRSASNLPVPGAAMGLLNATSGNNVRGGATFNFDDELIGAAAALGNVPKAVMERSLKPITEGYRTEQQAQDEVKKDFARDNPGSALTAQMVGGSAVPVAGTGKTAFKAAQGLRKMGATNAASKAGRVAARMRSSGPVARGIVTGAGVGALNAAGMADEISEVPGAIAEGGIAGAATGGILGGLATGGSAVARTLRDRRTAAQGGEEAVKARAYRRVGSLIDNIRGADDKPIGAGKVVSRISKANKTGADTRLMDQSAGLRAEAAYLSRDTNIPNSNRLQDLAEDRILARQGNFNKQTTSRAKTGNTDALRLRDSITDARKAQGKVDYREGGPMDQKVDWNPNIESFFKEAGPTTNRALRKAYDIMLDERRNPVELNADGIFTGVPTFRTLDYLKRGYDDLIESAVGSKNFSQARRISNELNSLKDMLIDQNPEYGMLLASQRDAFQQVQAIELGQKLFKGLRNAPRETLREVNGLPPNLKDDARIGIIYELLNLDVKADPVAAIRGMMRNRAQRKVLEFAFGSKKALNSFEQYVENEVKATLTDRFISAGRQSLTGTLERAGMSQQEAMQEIGGQAIKGFGFGGEVGLVANTIQGVKRAANSLNPEVQNDIARILMSKGEDLEKGLAASAKFFARRLARDRSRAATISKTVATPVGASVGEE